MTWNRPFSTNESILIQRLVIFLEGHEPVLFDKESNITVKVPDALSYYEIMLMSFYEKEIDSPTLRTNIDEHLKDIITFLNTTNEEYSVVLIEGRTHIPLYISASITIANTRYNEDYIYRAT